MGSINRERLISERIVCVRGFKVILDVDLAIIYGVTTKRLNEQVKRNKSRFPPDFKIKLSAQEKEEVVAKCDHLSNLKYSPALPSAFTEHGAIMIASVLNSKQAVEMSVIVVRAFVSLRKLLSTQKELYLQLKELEHQVSRNDKDIKTIFQVIHKLISEPEKPKKRIGFHT